MIISHDTAVCLKQWATIKITAWGNAAFKSMGQGNEIGEGQHSQGAALC